VTKLIIHATSENGSRRHQQKLEINDIAGHELQKMRQIISYSVVKSCLRKSGIRQSDT